MIKVENGTVTRELLPAFLVNLLPESLADLSWTDPALGVQNCAWWPEENTEGELAPNKKWGAEVFTLDPDRKVVKVARKQVAMTAAEKTERDEAIAAQWANLIESRRYQAEIAGITINNMRFDTDDRSKTLITGAALKAMRSTDFVLRWKTAEGFVDLPAAQVLIIADAVSDRTQLCFDREDALLGAVADGSITAAMVEEGWPV